MYYNSSTKWSCLRGNRTANIVAARTMLADSKLPTTFWAEAVNTACYVQNRVIVVKPHNKTPYKLFHGRTPTLSFMRPFGCPVTILNTIDHLGKFDGKADEGFFVGYSINSKASIETVPGKDYILLPLWTVDPPFSQSSKSSPNDGSKPSSDDGKKVDENPRKERLEVVGAKTSIEPPDNPNMPALEDIVYSDDEDVGAYSLEQGLKPLSTYLLDNGFQRGKIDKTLFIRRDKGDILLVQVKHTYGNSKALLKDEDSEEVDVHLYRSMIGSLMYLTSLRPDIMFAVYACARYQVNPKVLHFHVVKRIFRYLKGQPKLGLWYLKDSPFDLVAYIDSDYAGASLHGKSTIGGCQFLGCRLISWQCKKQTMVANSTIEAEYINIVKNYEKERMRRVVNIKTKERCVKTDRVLVSKRIERSVNAVRHILTTTGLLLLVQVNDVEDLHLEDAEGVDCLPNATIFEQLTLMGPKRKDTEVPQSSGPTNNIIDEVVNEEMDDSLVRAATTATSLDVEQDRGSGPRRQETIGDTIAQTRSENVSKHSNDLLLARVLDMENTKTTQTQEITSLTLRVKKLEKKGGSRTYKLKRLYKVSRSARVVSSDEASLGDQDDTSKQGRKIDDIDKDTKITLVDETQGRYGDDLMFDTGILDDEEVFAGQDMAEKEINVAEKEGKAILVEEPVKPKKKVQVMLDEEVAKKLQAELDKEDIVARGKAKKGLEANVALIVKWDDIQAKIDVDYQLAERLQAEEQQELSDAEKATLFMQLLEKRRKFFAAKRAEEKRNKPPTQAQQRKIMCTYLKNMEGKQLKDLKTTSFDTIQKMFDRAFKRVNTFVDYKTELLEETTNVDDDKETAELKQLVKIILDEEGIEIDAIPLAVKPPSIGNLKTMFNPHVEDEVWKLQQRYKVVNWKLYNNCGVHCLSLQSGYIYMLVEKKYPLTVPIMTDMVNKKLHAD
ncbi:uncharacterized mitochondrial protein-like protein [Tanacetum coccineum]